MVYVFVLISYQTEHSQLNSTNYDCNESRLRSKQIPGRRILSFNISHPNVTIEETDPCILFFLTSAPKLGYLHHSKESQNK